MTSKAVLNGIFAATLVSFTIIQLASCGPRINADNVCNKTIPIPRDEIVNEPIKYEIKYRAMCGILPCTKTRTEYRMDAKLKTIYVETQVAACCEGYTETPNGNCAPICIKSCNNGKCVRPNVCQCNLIPTEIAPGFSGSTCSRFVCLAVDRWGSKCDKECNCPPNSYCSASTGNCVCRNGWRGANCSEECDSSMNCEDIELPPIVEPDANVISDIIGPSQKLIARSMEIGDLNDENSVGSRTVASMMAAHMGVNLLLILLTISLLFAAVFYKRRWDQAKNELYQAAYSESSSTGSDSNYSPDSAYSCETNPSIKNRPRMPTPLESDFLSKNLSFATATRNIIMKGNTQPSEQSESRAKFLLDPRTESHLIASQKSSQQNIYSDVDSNFSDRSYSVATPRMGSTSIMDPILEGQLLSIRLDPTEDHTYQVPRSQSSSISPRDSLSGAHDTSSPYENEDIYEEIKPRSLDKQDL